MKRTLNVCFWLLSPENSNGEGSYQCLHLSLPWWLGNLIKVSFWYCLALIISLLIGNLR
jgi:hypothetical protein